MPNDYERADKIGLTERPRFEEGIPHHPESIRLMAFLQQHDFIDYNDFFGWKIGGDGDNGEVLMWQMDAYFELVDLDNAPDSG